GEGQLVLGDELLVRRGGVRGYAEDDDAALLDVLPGIAEAACLLRAAGRVVLGIEVEDHVPAGEVAEGHRLPLRVAQRERGRRLALLECHARTSVSRGCSEMTW